MTLLAQIASTLQDAIRRHQSGQFAQAEQACQRLLQLQNNHPDALHILGIIALQHGRLVESVTFIERALKSRPGDPAMLSNLAAGLSGQGRYADAIEAYDQALARQPTHAQALNNRGLALKAVGRTAEAITSFEAAIRAKPDYANAHCNLGDALAQLKRETDALASYERALQIQPNHAEALNNRGNMLKALMRPADALASFDMALAVRPDFADAQSNRGNVLMEMGRYAEALACHERSLTLKPDQPDNLINMGALLIRMSRFDEALARYERALTLDPENDLAFAGVVHASLYGCLWTRFDQVAAQLPSYLARDRSAVQPFVMLACPGSPDLQHKCALNHARGAPPVSDRPMWDGERYDNPRIRVAYLSADFRRHPLSLLTAGMFERHDRTRFETIAISYGADDGSDIRARLSQAFDQFIDVRGRTDEDVARLIRSLDVDIAVDLTGYTQDSRSRILAFRPAPVQVSYMGFPATMGVEFIDYIIADRVVIPLDEYAHYTEKVVCLPDTYWATDNTLEIAAPTPTRAEAGLPEAGFVFCCFNNSYKITRNVFAVWARILLRVPGSVLWLLGDNATAVASLRSEAARHGLDPQRLIFAPRAPLDQHLARHRAADLFLDTLPYNAHTTATDALWAGLPVLTRKGDTFVGRVAASILTALDLPELIAPDAAAYEELAVEVATNPSAMNALKHKLAANRLTTPLFDTERFTRNMEAAFSRMVAISRSGEPPTSFNV